MLIGIFYKELLLAAKLLQMLSTDCGGHVESVIVSLWCCSCRFLCTQHATCSCFGLTSSSIGKVMVSWDYLPASLAYSLWACAYDNWKRQGEFHQLLTVIPMTFPFPVSPLWFAPTRRELHLQRNWSFDPGGIRFIVTLQPSHCCSAEVSAALSHLSWPTQSLRVEILPTSLVNLLFKCRKMSREITVTPTILLQSVQAKDALHQAKSATSFVCGQATHGDKVPWLVLVLFPVYDHKLL